MLKLQVESSNKKGVEDTISAVDKEAFKASVPSFIGTPLPKKEAAKPDKPPPEPPIQERK